MLAGLMALAMIGSMITATDAAAQIACPCDYITVRVDDNINCATTVCYQLSPLGPIACHDLRPGESLRVPCPVYALGIRLCDGSIHWVISGGGPIPAVSVCSPVLTLSPGCCARVCRTTNDANGCPVLGVRAAPCPGLGCP